MKRKKELLFSMLLVICFSTFSWAQQIRISGKIISQSDKKPIPGVYVKSTSTGVQSDVNGNYSINATQGSILSFTSIGFVKKEIEVTGTPVINVELSENTNNLNEIVVIGFGAQKKSVVTGAISSVKASDLENQQITRVDDALKGRTSGVNVVQSSGSPGATPQILVRGITSINNSSPLYVIDGVVVDNGGIDAINPNDIASIEVLKDASAAIYGARASNGVILVTTKKGKEGPAKISYDGYMGLQSAVKKIQLTNASQYASLRNQSVTNDGGVAPFANPSAFGEGTNWQNLLFSNSALISNHGLNISGGTDKASYYTSFGYLDQQGVVDPAISNYKRFNFTINTSYKTKKWLTIGENFNLVYTKNQGSVTPNAPRGGPLGAADTMDPITPAVVTDPASQPNPNDYKNPYAVRNADGQLLGISAYTPGVTNPLAFQYVLQGNYNYAYNILGNAFVELEPISGLKIRSQISVKKALYGAKSFTPLYYYNPISNNTSTTNQFQESDQSMTTNFDNTISYNRDFGLHHFTILGGSNIQRENGSGITATFNGEPVNTFDQASPNFSLVSANKIAGGFDNQPYALNSLFGRVTYDYDQKYLFTGIIRRDGSSKFGSNNVYGTFPSAEVGYVISKEKFFPKNFFVSYLKIRGSYGILGNELSLSPFQYTSTIGSGRNYVYGNNGLAIGYSPNAPANPDLKWEQTASADIGLDAALFNDFNLTIDIYHKKTTGMLQQVQLPSYSGFSSQPYANIGNMENKGIEVELGYHKKLGQVNFNASGNISYNHNEVTSLGSQINFLTMGSIFAGPYEIGRTAVGQPVGAFYGFKETGVFHSAAEVSNYKNASGGLIQPNAKPGDFRWVDINGDGKIDANDRTFLGNPLPVFSYGVNFSADYRGFDIKIFGQGAWGNKIFQNYRRVDIATVNYPIAALDAWTPANPDSNYPRLSDNDPNLNFKNPSNFFLQNGAYFRIKTLQLGYSLPKSLVEKLDIQKIRVFMSSNNLMTFTGYKGYDPEISGGIDQGIYPQARTYILGLNITF